MGGIPLGPYLLQRRLAKGGMAEIFLARKEGPEGFRRDLVVKRILPHLAEDPEFTAMFREEARIAARLSHPNVVHVYDFGEEAGTPYLVMELVRGVDLRALIQRARETARAHLRGRSAVGALPAHHAAKILSFVCEGLAHAHGMTDGQGRPLGLVHRDVTPSNVLVSFDGAVKVVDFGVAKLQRTSKREVTRVGKVRGKYAYLSPEQSRGEPLDRRSDLFNVGILLFEALTGDTLFPHDDPREAKIAAASGRIPRPERLKQLPRGLRGVVERCLAARRERRYPDALALRADLEKFLRRSEPSDQVELGRYVSALFPDVVAEDRRAPRAAGTVPLTTALPPPGTVELPTPAVPEDAFDLASGFAPLGEHGGSTDLDPVPLGAADLPGPASSAEPRRPSHPTERLPSVRPAPRRRWAALVVLALLAAGGLGAWLLWPSAPAPPPLAPPGPTPPPATVTPSAPPQAWLRVRTVPSGLDVSLDGEPRGPAPLRLRVEAGAHRLAVRRGDEIVQESGIELAGGEEREVVLEAAAEWAELRIVSQPAGAEVRVGEERAGRTPLAFEVAPGEHEVVLALEGHVEHRQTIEARAGATSTLSVVLEEAPATGSAMRRPRGRGSLAIATQPWSRVYLGGRLLGTTPLTNVRLPAGRHVLVLRAPGRPERRHRVTIREGELTRVRVAL